MELTDSYYMKQALIEAQKAYKNNEIPVGAVIVANNKIIARAYNQTEQLKDVTAHAEIVAITSALNQIQGKYLQNCTLYVTLEPCVMCAGALFWAKISKIVYGASDPKQGYSTKGNNILHPKTEVTHGILESECATLIKDFFQEKRNQ